MVALSKGEGEALDEIYRRYQKMLFGFVFRYVRNSDLAKDVVQETFLRVYQNRESYRPTAKFSSWIFKIARNLCIDEKRRYWNRNVKMVSQMVRDGEEESMSMSDFPAGNRTGAHDVLDGEIDYRIKEAIESLSPEQQEVLLLSKYEGLSYREIADVLGIATESVKQRAYRGHMRLRQALKDLIEE